MKICITFPWFFGSFSVYRSLQNRCILCERVSAKYPIEGLYVFFVKYMYLVEIAVDVESAEALHVASVAGCWVSIWSLQGDVSTSSEWVTAGIASDEAVDMTTDVPAYSDSKSNVKFKLH